MFPKYPFERPPVTPYPEIRMLHNRKGEVVGHTILDAEDLHLLEGRYHNLMTNGYVGVLMAGRTMSYLHRVIMQPGPGLVVDHINGDKLDNRRCNLRVCTQAENMLNRKANTGRVHKGLYWYANRWIAKLCVNGITHHIGRFKTIDEAKAAYTDACRRLHGEFARP